MRLGLKWWFVVLPLALISLLVAFTQSADIEPEFTASVSVLLVGSNQAEVLDPESGELVVVDVNPLTGLGGSMSTVALVTAEAVSDGMTIDQLEDDGFSTGVNVWAENRNPIIHIEVLDTDRQIAGSTADRLVELIAINLDERQNSLGAPEIQRIFVEQVSSSTIGGPDYGGRNRVIIAFTAVGFRGFGCRCVLG